MPLTPINTYLLQQTDTVPQPFSYFGQPGWWTVPQAWYNRTDENQVRWTSPNEDFSSPKYVVQIDATGTMVFQDLARNALTQ